MISETMLQRIQQFDIEHGDDPVRVGTFLYFRDGAMREVNPWGQLTDPPEDPHICAKRIARYWEVRLDRAVKAFDKKKEQLRQQAESTIRDASSNMPPPPPDEESLAALRLLRCIVRRMRRRFEAARAKVQETVPPWVREQEANADVLRQMAQSALADIDRIEV